MSIVSSVQTQASDIFPNTWCQVYGVWAEVVKVRPRRNGQIVRLYTASGDVMDVAADQHVVMALEVMS